MNVDEGLKQLYEDAYYLEYTGDKESVYSDGEEPLMTDCDDDLSDLEMELQQQEVAFGTLIVYIDTPQHNLAANRWMHI